MKIYDYILCALLLVVTACSSDNGLTPPVVGAGDKCELVVSVVAKENNARATRSDVIWNENPAPEPGVLNEDLINEMSLYFVSSDGVSTLLIPTLLNTENGVYEYKTTVSLSADYVDRSTSGDYRLSGRIVAVANKPGPADATPFVDSPFVFDEIMENGAIPMWGVTSLNNVQLIKDGTVNVGDIKMLRALPKLTFRLSDEIKDDYVISSIECSDSKFEKKGHCLPFGGENVMSTGSLYIEKCFHPVDDASAMGQVSASGYVGLGTNKVMLYTPERRIEHPAGTYDVSTYFKVTLKRKSDGFPIIGQVYFTDYINGIPAVGGQFDGLVRNHDYQFVISLMELEFNVYFYEWIPGGNVHIELE